MTDTKESRAKAIQQFLAAKNPVFVGVSRDKKKFSYQAWAKVRQKFPNLIPVHPSMKEVDGVPCYPSLQDVPAGVDAVIYMAPAGEAEAVVRQAVQRNIPNLWLQQKADSPEAVELAQTHGLNLVWKSCILMYIEPVDSVHKVHRWLQKIFGQYPLT